MRKWGVLITLFYALVLLGILIPATALLLVAKEYSNWWVFFFAPLVIYKEWIFCFLAAVLLVGQILLLFLSVDTSRQKLKPRAHVFVSACVAAMLVALLMFASIFSLYVGVKGDNFVGNLFETHARILGFWAFLWLAWGIVFLLYFRNSSLPVTRIVSWLLKGSVLELLVAVPCHIIVRRRDDCSAPYVTSFGIATGIAIMLLSFGPSVLLLYKKRLDDYSDRPAENTEAPPA